MLLVCPCCASQCVCTRTCLVPCPAALKAAHVIFCPQVCDVGMKKGRWWCKKCLKFFRHASVSKLPAPMHVPSSSKLACAVSAPLYESLIGIISLNACSSIPRPVQARTRNDANEVCGYLVATQLMYCIYDVCIIPCIHACQSGGQARVTRTRTVHAVEAYIVQ
jgi:hypothetical protein